MPKVKKNNNNYNKFKLNLNHKIQEQFKMMMNLLLLNYIIYQNFKFLSYLKREKQKMFKNNQK